MPSPARDRLTHQTSSYWMTTATVSTYPPLKTDATADVCIVGAGIAGLSCAYVLLKEGKSVIVLDDGPIGGGETQRTTAHLSYMLGTRYADLARMHGEDGTRMIAESHALGIDLIETIVHDEKIDCAFERVDGYLFLGEGDDRSSLEKDRDVLHAIGMKDVELLPAYAVGGTDLGPALRVGRQGQCHPLRYIEGLATVIVQRGGKIFTGTHVSRVEDGKPCVVTAANGRTVRAADVIVATNAPINDTMSIYAKQVPYRTFAIAATLRKPFPKALLWDTTDPYHYVRAFEDTLIVGGEDHRSGTANDAPLRYQRLEQWARARFPMIGDVVDQWSGQVMESADGIAMIGYRPHQKHVFVVTGDSGNGLTHGSLAALLLRDVIMTGGSSWQHLYSPSRAPNAIGQLMKDGVTTAVQLTKRFTTSGRATDSIPLDSGAVVRRGMHNVAVYKDADGTLTELSAICPHKGCLLAWNSGEKTWDCPCHGSRFDRRGTVLNGPARSNMQPLEKS